MAENANKSSWKKYLPYLFMFLIAVAVSYGFLATTTQVDEVTGKRSFRDPKPKA